MASEVRLSVEDEATPQNGFARAAWCGLYGSGIIGTLVLYGVLQERIMDGNYGEDESGEPIVFTDSVFLVFCNRCANCLFALVMSLLKRENLCWEAPLWKYLLISLSNVLASTCQYEALKYVIFPVQMLGKSFKMMPVMLWSIIVSGKRYRAVDWLIALLVTFGVTEFLLTGEITSSHHKPEVLPPHLHGHSTAAEAHLHSNATASAAAGGGASSHSSPEANSVKGLLLIVGFLALDGFTSTFQEHLFRQYTMSKYNQILYINAASILTSSSGLIIGGGFVRSIAFASEHPSFIGDAGMLSSAAAGSQWFIYSQIKEFGALVFAATMNVRQLVSIIISYIKFGHSISRLQVVGLVMVFSALFCKSYLSLTSKPNADLPSKDQGAANGSKKGQSGEDLESSASEKVQLLQPSAEKPL